MSFDWTQFVRRVDINADVATIYTLLATGHGLEKWFLRKADFCSAQGNPRPADEHGQAGDTYSWLWHGWPDDTREKGQILQANGSNLLQFTFGGDSDKPMVVTITLNTQQGITMLSLTQENIPANEHGKQYYNIGCREGWTFYLANLKSVAEGGIDLRNREISMENMINK